MTPGRSSGKIKLPSLGTPTDRSPPAGRRTVHSRCLDQRSYQVTSSDRLVRAPDGSRADRSLARHSASEEPSQARTRRGHHQHYECEVPANTGAHGPSAVRGPRHVCSVLGRRRLRGLRGATEVDIQQIVGAARSVSQLLSNTRYGLDFYQREYKWAEVQVAELLDDLADRFLDEYESSHERRHVASYRPYFLGPIVTAQRDGVRYLVDGQQRITTLTLLLICLRRWLKNPHPEDAQALNLLIFSTYMGRRTFNLDVPERADCLQAILDDDDFDPSKERESVRNLWDRYRTILERFPDDLRGDNGQVLPYFTDWLQHRVTLVEIGVLDQDMALEIFETMNDRGLRLTNIDMLKSYLVARVGDEDVIRDLNERWRRHITELTDVEDNADSDFVKAWLRGNYADTIRQRRAKASPGDFDIVGTAFHKWVREKSEDLGDC